MLCTAATVKCTTALKLGRKTSAFSKLVQHNNTMMQPESADTAVTEGLCNT